MQILTSEDVNNCNSIEDFENLKEEKNILFYWQKQTTEFVFTYDCMPKGCIDDYYGSDIDLLCPGAWAFRKRIWPVFSFEQARQSEEFRYYDPECAGEKHWQSFGFKDCMLVLSGTPGLDSFASFGFDFYIENPRKVSLPYIALTHKMDVWFNHHPELIPYPREFSGLSSREKEIMMLHIKNPELSSEMQAHILGISPRTMKGYRERIAKKYDVTTFTGAVTKAIKLREFDFNSVEDDKKMILSF